MNFYFTSDLYQFHTLDSQPTSAVVLAKKFPSIKELPYFTWLQWRDWGFSASSEPGILEKLEDNN
jgi:hypothetical protein